MRVDGAFSFLFLFLFFFFGGSSFVLGTFCLFIPGSEAGRSQRVSWDVVKGPVMEWAVLLLCLAICPHLIGQHWQGCSVSNIKKVEEWQVFTSKT